MNTRPIECVELTLEEAQQVAELLGVPWFPLRVECLERAGAWGGPAAPDRSRPCG